MRCMALHSLGLPGYYRETRPPEDPMDKPMPRHIFAFLSRRVLGQEDVLRKLAVALYKHVNGIRGGNVLLMGNSGTGKTTVMKTVREFYHEVEGLADFRTMVIMNANTLVDEEGVINTDRIFQNLETVTRQQLGPAVDGETLKRRMENATVCFDELDKLSARIAGKTFVTGIAFQQALLTILEGETVVHETIAHFEGKPERVRIPIDTHNLLFICGGAFEELYNQVYVLIRDREDDRRFREEKEWDEEEERLHKKIVFSLKEYLRMSDIFEYGMLPQFLSRFGSIAILEDLKTSELKDIFLKAEDSPYLTSVAFFKTFGIVLRVSAEALDIIAHHAAANTRIGARALREVFGRIIADFEFDPFGFARLDPASGEMVIEITSEVVKANLGAKPGGL